VIIIVINDNYIVMIIVINDNCRWSKTLAVVALIVAVTTAVVNVWGVATINRSLLPQVTQTTSAHMQRHVSFAPRSPYFAHSSQCKHSMLTAPHTRCFWRTG